MNERYEPNRNKNNFDYDLRPANSAIYRPGQPQQKSRESQLEDDFGTETLNEKLLLKHRAALANNDEYNQQGQNQQDVYPNQSRSYYDEEQKFREEFSESESWTRNESKELSRDSDLEQGKLIGIMKKKTWKNVTCSVIRSIVTKLLFELLFYNEKSIFFTPRNYFNQSDLSNLIIFFLQILKRAVLGLITEKPKKLNCK